MINCLQCGNSNPVGTVFCVECGAVLIGQVRFATASVSESASESAEQGSASRLAWAVLHVGDSSHAFPLGQRDEFILGRADDSQARVPDIDLSPYGAFAAGVSRIHAAIRHKSGRILLADLDSANGTYINGQRLDPRVEADLKDRDVILLGALKLQVRVRTTR